MTEQMEVSTVSNDTYHFLIDLSKKTKAEMETTAQQIEAKKKEIKQLQQDVINAEHALEALEKHHGHLNDKAAEVDKMRADLDKNRDQFKRLVTFSKAK